MYQKSKKNKNCKLCNNIFLGGNLELYCDECKYKISHNICKKCGKEFELLRSDYNIEACPDCIIGEPNRYIGYCKECGNYFYYGSPKSKKCPKCNNILCEHNKKFIYCQECSPREKIQIYNAIKDDFIEQNNDLSLFKIKSNNSKKMYQKVCKICNRNFIGSGPTANWCGSCYYILECNGCGLKFASRDKHTLVCSQECSGIYFHKQGNIANPNIGNYHIININPMKINIESYTEININNLNEFDNISGVWFKTDNNNQLLDVCLTTDIKQEVEYHYWAIKNKPNLKYGELSKYENIKLYFLCNIDSWDDGLKKEFDFAIKNNAKYWNPAPGIQVSWLKEINN